MNKTISVNNKFYFLNQCNGVEFGVYPEDGEGNLFVFSISLMYHNPIFEIPVASEAIANNVRLQMVSYFEDQFLENSSHNIYDIEDILRNTVLGPLDLKIEDGIIKHKIA